MKGLATYGPEPGVYRTVGLPGGEARIVRFDWHRQLLDVTPRTPGPFPVATQSWREVAPLPDGEYGWAEVEREDGTRERWLIEHSRWHRKLDADEPDPVIEERPIVGEVW